MTASESFLESFEVPTLAELMSSYQYRSGASHALENLAVQQALETRGSELVDVSEATQYIAQQIDAGQTEISATVTVSIVEDIDIDVTIDYVVDVDYNVNVNVSANVLVDMDFQGFTLDQQIDTFTIQSDFAQDSRVSNLRHDYVRGQGYDSTHGNFWFRVEDDADNKLPIPHSGGQFSEFGFEEGGQYGFFAVEKGTHGLSVGDQLTDYQGAMVEAQARYRGGDPADGDVAYANNFDAEKLFDADPKFLNGFTLATVDMGTGEVMSLLNQHNHNTNWANALASQATEDIQVI